MSSCVHLEGVEESLEGCQFECDGLGPGALWGRDGSVVALVGRKRYLYSVLKSGESGEG